MTTSLQNSPRHNFWRRFVGGIYQRIPQNFVDWIETEFKLSPDATNSSGQWTCRPFQKAICHVYANLDIIEVIVIKCSQVGCTQIVKAFCGYEVAHRGRNCAAIQPTQGFARWFSNLQIKTLLRDCAAVRSELRVEHTKKDTQNTTEMRVFKRGTLYCKGAHSGNDFRGYSVDTIAVDELSGCKPNIDDEGSADTLAAGRVSGSMSPKKIFQSTPKQKGECRTEAIYNEIYPEFQFERHVRCVHCDYLQPLSWGGRDANFGIKWEKVIRDDRTVDAFESSETAHFQCCSCSDTFGHELITELDRSGRWQSTKFYIDDETGKFYSIETDEEVKTPYKVGFHICGTIGHIVSWQKAVYEYLTAVEMARKGDNSSLIRFTNEYLGEAYQPRENSDLVTWEQLQARQEEYLAECPAEVQHITIGGDVGKDHLAYEIVGWGFGYESWSLDTGRIMCSPLQSNAIDKLFPKLMDMEFEKPDGSTISAGIGFFDSRYGGNKVIETCAKRPFEMIPILGVESVGGQLMAKMPLKADAITKVYRTKVGVQTVADYVSALMKVEPNPEGGMSPGYQHFPFGEKYNDDFFKSITAEEMITDWSKGKPVTRWAPKSKSVRNEQTDCRRYATAAMNIYELRYNKNLVHPDEFISESEGADDEDMEELKKRLKQAR